MNNSFKTNFKNNIKNIIMIFSFILIITLMILVFISTYQYDHSATSLFNLINDHLKKFFQKSFLRN